MILDLLLGVQGRVVLGAVLLSVMGWLYVSRAGLRAELAEARAQYGMCRAANADWEAKAAQERRALDIARRVEVERARQAEKTVKAENKIAEWHEEGAIAWMTQGQANGGCGEAIRMVEAYRKSGRP